VFRWPSATRASEQHAAINRKARGERGSKPSSFQKTAQPCGTAAGRENNCRRNSSPMKISHFFYLLSAIFSRLLPASMSNFAEQTLNRYHSTRGYSPSYFEDKELSSSRSIYWRLVRARNREKYFQGIAARYIARGLVRNSASMLKLWFFALMAWIGLSHSLPLSLAYVRELLNRVL